MTQWQGLKLNDIKILAIFTCADASDFWLRGPKCLQTKSKFHDTTPDHSGVNNNFREEGGVECELPDSPPLFTKD